MPVFALANAGVKIESLEYFDIFQYSAEWGSVGMGIFFGLLVGKPLGIWLTSLIAVKCGIAERPAGASWKMLLAVACLGGIGFTMSIFVDSLAFDKQTHAEFIDKGKIAILMGSACAALLGSALIILFSRRGAKNTSTDEARILFRDSCAGRGRHGMRRRKGRSRECRDA